MKNNFMALFKKKKKIEEEIPEAPEFLKFPESVQYETEEEIPDFPSGKPPIERIKKWGGEKKYIKKLPSKLTREISKKTIIKSKPKSKALFIKIEKFKEIVASIELISRKISELEDISQKIKQIKAKEDSEIADWQEQLNEIKSRLERIEEHFESKI
jgi:hypothetical protein